MQRLLPIPRKQKHQELSSCPNSQTYYSRIAAASMDSRLFHTTIRENLLLAAPHAAEAQLYEACSHARFQADLQKMPEKLDTASDLYIIDEAFSHRLDHLKNARTIHL